MTLPLKCEGEMRIVDRASMTDCLIKSKQAAFVPGQKYEEHVKKGRG